MLSKYNLYSSFMIESKLLHVIDFYSKETEEQIQN